MTVAESVPLGWLVCKRCSRVLGKVLTEEPSGDLWEPRSRWCPACVGLLRFDPAAGAGVGP